MAGGASGLDITFQTEPDPPRVGDLAFEVMVKDAGGSAGDRGDVSATLFMPAMPSMNHPGDAERSRRWRTPAAARTAARAR